MKPGSKSLKIQDLNELHDLVAEHLDDIEPGLSIVDSRPALSGATIDIVAVDARGTLALVTLAFEADDAMLLRALDAYSWCLEYPDELRAHYPNVALQSDTPRVLFIAERLTEGFLRKIKHLKIQRADCLEFHFGLQFRRVGEIRAAVAVAAPAPEPAVRATRVEPAPAKPEPVAAAARPQPVAPPKRPPAAAPERVVSASAEPARNDVADDGSHDVRSPAASDAHDDLLEQLRATTGVPTAEWREDGGTAGGDVDEEKIRTVREYLQKEFPTAVIYDFYAHGRGVQMFHLQDSHGALIHSAAIGEDLLDATSDDDLRAFLDKHKLARVLRQAGSAGVSVARAGLKIERR